MLDHSILYSIFSGKALLFLGAGFSFGATRIKDGRETTFPLGQDLANELLFDLNIKNSEKKNLASCASFYESKKTRKGLLYSLAEKLEVKKAQDYHYDILSYPWWRIYTTNYDNLVQLAMPATTKIRRIGLRDEIPQYTTFKTDCLYINGFIDYNDIEKSEIIITKTDYSSPINYNRDNIIYNFLEDVTMVEKVFFIGYSLYDIEVAKILQNNTSIRNKVYFIVSPGIDEIDEQELLSFGSVIKIGVQKFSIILGEAAIKYKMIPQVIDETFFSLEKYDAYQEKNKERDNVFELLMNSRINRYCIKRQLEGQQLYAVLRRPLEEIKQRVLSGYLLTGIYARLCNGKTIFFEELAAVLSDVMPVYFARPDAQSLKRDLVRFSKQLGEQRVVIFVDGYARAFPNLEPVIGKLPNITFIIAERTPVHRALWDKISKNISDAAAFSLDMLEDSEKEIFIELLRNNGLSGETKEFLFRQFDDLYENSIGRSIFSLIKDSEVAERYIKKIKKDIELSIGYENELYVAVILSIINGGLVSKTLINKILQSNNAYSREFSNSKIFEDILKDDGNYVLCSGGISLEITKFVFHPEKSLDILIRIITACQRTPHDKFLTKLCEQCLRFFYLEKVLPADNFKNNVRIFYETVRNIGNMGGHPLFWLQFAIAMFNQKEFFKSKIYLDTASKSAKNIEFNPFQIDNFRARLLLASDASIGIDPWLRFSDAREILFKQVNKKNDEYIYRSASAINSFVNYYADGFEYIKLVEIGKFIKTILNKATEATGDIQFESRHSLKRLSEAYQVIEVKLNKIQQCNEQ